MDRRYFDLGRAGTDGQLVITINLLGALGWSITKPPSGRTS